MQLGHQRHAPLTCLSKDWLVRHHTGEKRKGKKKKDWKPTYVNEISKESREGGFGVSPFSVYSDYEYSYHWTIA